ncbi:hypothetical protein WP3W19E03_09430 [Aeromonas veronii]|uniref:Uncharacterized protein n=1 Tax=Aeromonas veronii TaxID=654 RepID=A0A6S5C7H1_AERVE|nr:hypothetical protein WP3W19E03_09430 [Aeromonas veronii]
MLVIHSYSIAIIMCIITMICWGSWANTTKLVDEKNGLSSYIIGTIQSASCCLPCCWRSR